MFRVWSPVREWLLSLGEAQAIFNCCVGWREHGRDMRNLQGPHWLPWWEERHLNWQSLQVYIKWGVAIPQKEISVVLNEEKCIAGQSVQMDPRLIQREAVVSTVAIPYLTLSGCLLSARRCYVCFAFVHPHSSPTKAELSCHWDLP